MNSAEKSAEMKFQHQIVLHDLHDKYLAIYFQVFAYKEPQMNTDNADACLPSVRYRREIAAP